MGMVGYTQTVGGPTWDSPYTGGMFELDPTVAPSTFAEDGGYQLLADSWAVGARPDAININFTFSDTRRIAAYIVDTNDAIIGIGEYTDFLGTYDLEIPLTFTSYDIQYIIILDATNQTVPIGSIFPWDHGYGPNAWPGSPNIEVNDIAQVFYTVEFWEDFVKCAWDSDNLRLVKNTPSITVLPGSPGYPGSPGQPYIPPREYFVYETRTVYDTLPVDISDAELVFIPNDESLPDGPGHWVYIIPEGYSFATTTVAHTVTVRVKKFDPGQPYIPPSPPIPAEPARTLLDYGLAWDSSAISIEFASNNFDFRFKVLADASGVIIGMSDVIESYSREYSSIDYAFYISQDEYCIIENGAAKTSFSAYTTSAEFKLLRVGRIVEYYIGGTLVYTGDVDAKGEQYRAFVFMYGAGDYVHSASLSFNNDGAAYGIATGNKLLPTRIVGFSDLGANESAGVLYLATSTISGEQDVFAYGTLYAKEIDSFGATFDGYTSGVLRLAPSTISGSANSLVAPKITAGMLYAQPIQAEYCENLTGGVSEGELSALALLGFGANADNIQVGSLRARTLGGLGYNSPAETGISEGELSALALAGFGADADNIQVGSFVLKPGIFGFSESNLVKTERLDYGKYYVNINGILFSIYSLSIENYAELNADGEIINPFDYTIKKTASFSSKDVDALVSAYTLSNGIISIEKHVNNETRTIYTGVIDPTYTSISKMSRDYYITLKANNTAQVENVGKTVIVYDVISLDIRDTNIEINLPWVADISVLDIVQYAGYSFKAVNIQVSISPSREIMRISNNG